MISRTTKLLFYSTVSHDGSLFDHEPESLDQRPFFQLRFFSSPSPAHWRTFRSRTYAMSGLQSFVSREQRRFGRSDWRQLHDCLWQLLILLGCAYRMDSERPRLTEFGSSPPRLG